MPKKIDYVVIAPSGARGAEFGDEPVEEEVAAGAARAPRVPGRGRPGGGVGTAPRTGGARPPMRGGGRPGGFGRGPVGGGRGGFGGPNSRGRAGGLAGGR